METYADNVRMQVKVYAKRTRIDCTDSNGDYCIEGITDNCITCKQPGEVPLLQRDTNTQHSKGSCKSQCSSSYYMFDKFCFNCNANCKECLGPKESDCTACDASNAASNVFDSGRCGSACFKGQS